MEFENIRERIADYVETIFLQYQNENGIKDGGLMPDLYLDIDNKIEALTESIINGLDFQNKYNR